MLRIATIVEGRGEVEALPLLLRRIAGEVGLPVDVPRPIRVARQTLTAAIDLAAARTAPSFDKLWREVVALLEAV